MPILNAPQDGVTVRMYRHGHGDCFLLAFPNDTDGSPVHVLIDCGYKPGSQRFLPTTGISQIVKHIETSTGKNLDLVIITHEHQDHLNGIWKKRNPYFQNFKIEKAWFAWTESPTDRLAKKFRKKHGDQLLQLVEARNKIASLAGTASNKKALNQLDEFLGMEFGGEDNRFDLKAMRFAASNPAASTNKQAIKLIRDAAEANDGVEYLSPGASLLVPNTDVRAYILGPPRRESLLTDEDPRRDEEFHFKGGLSFGAAVSASKRKPISPFADRYSTGRNAHFKARYGEDGSKTVPKDGTEIPDDASWRRIDGDWMHTAENLALKLNTGINNTSLVVAFELPKSKRVLLFAGDAQRGSWVSWDKKSFQVGNKRVTARDLLGRTVLYKVGHHGSHNATLDGTADDDHPNLSWMGSEKYGEEFTAMITAVNKWAMTKNNPPWRHPLPAIKRALEEKAQGRVLQIDIDKPRQPNDVSNATWKDFTNRTDFQKLYFDYTVRDA